MMTNAICTFLRNPNYSLYPRRIKYIPSINVYYNIIHINYKILFTTFQKRSAENEDIEFCKYTKVDIETTRRNTDRKHKKVPTSKN